MSHRPWSLGLAVAMAAHGMIVGLVIAPHTLVPPPKPAGAAVLLDLPPLASPAQAPEPQPQPKPAVKKPRPAAAKPAPPQALALPQAAPEPPATESAAPAPASTQPAPPSPDPHAVSSWQGRLLAHLERHKRFPSLALSRRLRGTVLVGFSLDRSGMVLAPTVDTSSGHASLDAAALDMLTRAQPLPAPPPEIAGAVVQLTVPVRFFLN